MAKLKLWTIFYPTGKKNLTVNLSKRENQENKEHWKLLNDEVTTFMGMLSFENFIEQGLGEGEQSYVNYIVANCVNQHIPVLQYVEASNYWMMFLPDETVRLEAQQYRDIIELLPVIKKYSINHHFVASNIEQDGLFHTEQKYEEFSKRMIHDYYGMRCV